MHRQSEGTVAHPTIQQLFDLSGKVALVTGGARNLGRDMAAALAEAGADVAITGRDLERTKLTACELIAETGHLVGAYACDVRYEDQVAAMVDAVLAGFGRIDMLVNNAGNVVSTPENKPIEKRPTSEWEFTIAVNLTGVFLCSKHVIAKAILSVLIVGCGSIGKRHARVLHGLGVRDLRACDALPEQRAGLLAQVPTVRMVQSYAAGLADGPDVVLIGTPPVLHIPMALDAIRAGSHVLIEKPLSDSLAGVDDLTELAGAAHKKVMVALCTGGVIVVEFARWDRCTVAVYSAAPSVWEYEEIATDRDDMFRAEDREFLEAIAEDRPIRCTIAEARKSVEVVLACQPAPTPV